MTPRPHCTREIHLVPIALESGWAPEPVWTGADNLAPTRIPSADREIRSESLHALPISVFFV